MSDPVRPFDVPDDIRFIDDEPAAPKPPVAAKPPAKPPVGDDIPVAPPVAPRAAPRPVSPAKPPVAARPPAPPARKPIPKDPMDDFDLIEEGPVTRRPAVRRPSPSGSHRRPQSSEPARRRRPEPVSKPNWLLWGGIGAGVLGFVVALVVVLMPGSKEKGPSERELIAAMKELEKFDMKAFREGAAKSTKSGSSTPKPPPPAFLPVSNAAVPKYSGKPIESFAYGDKKIVASCIDGRGRYLFIALELDKELHVIDLAKGVEERVLNVGETLYSNTELVAGVDVVVAETMSGVFSWRIGQFDRPPAKGSFKYGGGKPLMGAATNGPLIRGYSGGVEFFDPLTLQPFRYDTPGEVERSGVFSGRPDAINSTGTLVASYDYDRHEVCQFWGIGPDTIRRMPSKLPPLKPNPGVQLPRVLCADGKTMATAKQYSRVSDWSTFGDFEDDNGSIAAFSNDPSDQLLAVCNSGLGVTLRKPGQEEPVARLAADAKAVAMISGFGGNYQRTVPKSLFCVRESNLVVVVTESRAVIWHADPARQVRAGR